MVAPFKYYGKILVGFCLNPIQDGPLWGCSRMGDKKTPIPKICHTCPTMMKLGTVISYPKGI